MRCFQLTSLQRFVLVLVLMLCVPNCGRTAPAGPLFVQAHFTSPVSSIPKEALEKLLEGDTETFRKISGIRGKISVYCDTSICSSLSGKYPRLRARPAPFLNERSLRGNRNFLGISDARGLAPFFKTLYIDNALPWGTIDRDYVLKLGDNYPFTLKGAVQWHNDRHIAIVQTGVTAMTRAFIRAVKKYGIDYPAKETAKITSTADIAMTSNEVSFLEPCSYPFKNKLRFCSPEEYFSILVKSGFDAIELTGNHNNDYGTQYNLDSIAMIRNAGMVYFGGGKNIRDAYRVRKKTVKGYTVTFTGFNEIGPPPAWATEKGPGAAKLTRKRFIQNVKDAVHGGDIAMVTVQWCNENDYRKPWKQQVDYFHMAAALGADIIVSSSAHKVMGIEFYRGKFISYGLGNFLFDQMHSIHYRRGIMARHHIYDGRHVETELVPYIIHNYCRPRILRGSEARSLLRHVFRYSRGDVFK